MPVAPSAELIDEIRASLPELPLQKAERYENELGHRRRHRASSSPSTPTSALTSRRCSPPPATAPTPSASATGSPASSSPDIGADADPAESKVTPEALAQLVELVKEKTVTNTGAKTVLDKLVEDGGDPDAIVEAEGLAAMGDSDELAGIIDAALEANPKAADDMRAGNMKAIGAIIGFVMKQTQGRADGGEVTRIVREKLGL